MRKKAIGIRSTDSLVSWFEEKLLDPQQFVDMMRTIMGSDWTQQADVSVGELKSVIFQAKEKMNRTEMMRLCFRLYILVPARKEVYLLIDEFELKKADFEANVGFDIKKVNIPEDTINVNILLNGKHKRSYIMELEQK